LIENYIQSLKNELNYRAESFCFPIKTIYFGGGTPSLLKTNQIEEIILTIFEKYDVLPNPEITCECNPDDLNFEYLKKLREVGINRLNIGIQSFLDNDLQFMNRRHNAKQALDAVEQSIKAGFDNIGVDMIYGLPWNNQKSFSENLKKFADLPVQHLSAYHLTIEKDTPFSKRNIKELDDTESFRQYKLLCETMNNKGMIHYEVSNFCLPDFHSKHNSSNWEGKPYLGIGAGAHSFYKGKRFWNKQDISIYKSDNFNFVREEEILTENNKFNELIMLRLRTYKGIDLSKTETEFQQFFKNFMKTAKKWQENGVLYVENNHLKCREEKWFIIDKVISDFVVF